MERTNRKDADVLNRFYRTFMRDRAAGASRSLRDYQDMHPGHEELIELEHNRLSSGETEVEGGPGDALGAALGAHPAGARIGHYRVERELGRGGQGTVLLAEDTRLGRPVALKVLTGLATLSTEHLQRFHREAALASRLDHPGLCSVYDSNTIDGVPYVAMRYVEGVTLAEQIGAARREERTLDSDEVLRWVAGAARAVAAAHRAGVVHRDLKPANLMLTPKGDVVVLDFGLAREFEAAGSTLTRTGDVFGTPAYMAPEQLDPNLGSSDGRTDVWGLGVVLFEALTLELPFQAPTREALYHAILAGRPAGSALKEVGASRALDTVVMTALAAERERRYASADALADDLEALLEGRPISARRVGPLGRMRLWAKREPVLAVTLGAVLVLLLAATGLGGYLFASQREISAGEEALRRASLNDTLSRVMGGRVSNRTLENMREGLAAEPEHDYLRIGQICHEVSTEDYEEALAVIDALPEGRPEPEAFERFRARVLRGLGREEEAKAVEETLGEPDGPLDCFVAAWLTQNGTPIWNSGAESTAKSAVDYYLRSALLSEEPFEMLYHGLVQTAIGAGEYETAKLAADALAHRWPNSAMAWFNIGVSRPRDMEGAREAFQRSIELDPEFAQPHTSLAVLKAVGGEVDEGERLYLRSVDLVHIDSAKARLHLAWERTMRLLDQPERALAACNRALALTPNAPEALVRAGVLYQELERFDEADEVLFYALELDPDNAEARELLGMD